MPEGLSTRLRASPELLLRRAVHPDKHAAGAVLRPPTVNVRGDAAPAAQVEVADAEVRPGGEGEGLLERREEFGLGFEVVEYPRHGNSGGSNRF